MGALLRPLFLWREWSSFPLTMQVKNLPQVREEKHPCRYWDLENTVVEMLLFPSLSLCMEKTAQAQTAAAQKKSATGLISHAEEFLLLLWHSGKISFLWHFYPLMLFVYNHPGASSRVWCLTSGQCKLGIRWPRSPWKPIIDLIFNVRLLVQALLLLSSQNVRKALPA